MTQGTPIFESSELRLFRYKDEYIRYFDNACNCGDPQMPGDSQCEMRLASEILRSGTEDTFVAEIMGDSMRDADIRMGDRVIINTEQEARDGDIVLASLAGDILLKILRYDQNGDSWLYPANELYQPRKVHFDGETNRIIGVMTSIVRDRPRISASLIAMMDKRVKEMYRTLQISDEEDKPIYKLIPAGKDKRTILERLHEVLDGHEGIYVVKVLAAAISINYLTDFPSHGMITKEFKIRISSGQFYRDKSVNFSQDEIEDIIQSLI